VEDSKMRPARRRGPQDERWRVGGLQDGSGATGAAALQWRAAAGQ
jgi:hypothetical protein